MALPPILPAHRAPLRSGGRAFSQHPPPLRDYRRISVSKEELSSPWPPATPRRQHRDPLLPNCRYLEQMPRAITGSYESVIHPRSPGLSRREAPRPHRAHPPHPAASSSPQDGGFSLHLTPEAILVIQKRSLEKQRRGRRMVGGSSGLCPRSPLHRPPPDPRKLIKVSLLNEQHRYDDMEYEEEGCWLGDEGLVRKCTEWLQGVEMAAGRGGDHHDQLRSVPHLSTY
ncbi:proline-rich protein 18 [Dendropsophus ebraccatus]|uniref:proline-rich protein 18 n=1 Tax=Dendropsophus ebraccatus TaxID=150705 RepID=UPI003831E50E